MARRRSTRTGPSATWAVRAADGKRGGGLAAACRATASGRGRGGSAKYRNGSSEIAKQNCCSRNGSSPASSAIEELSPAYIRPAYTNARTARNSSPSANWSIPSQVDRPVTPERDCTAARHGLASPRRGRRRGDRTGGEKARMRVQPQAKHRERVLRARQPPNCQQRPWTLQSRSLPTLCTLATNR